MLEEMSFVQFSLYSKDFVSFLASTEALGSVFREYFSMCYHILHLLLLLTSVHCHSWLCLGCVAGTPEAGAASRAIWVFPGFDATRVCLEHVHSGPDCPGDLFSHRKPLPEGQLLSQHGWIQTHLELSPWSVQVSVQVPGPAVHGGRFVRKGCACMKFYGWGQSGMCPTFQEGVMPLI